MAAGQRGAVRRPRRRRSRPGGPSRSGTRRERAALPRADLAGQLWRVVDAEPIVDEPARLVRLEPTAIVLDVATAEPVLVRVRYSNHFSLDVAGCVRPTPDGWTVVDVEEPGVVTVSAVLARSLPLIGPLDRCAEGA